MPGPSPSRWTAAGASSGLRGTSFPPTSRRGTLAACGRRSRRRWRRCGPARCAPDTARSTASAGASPSASRPVTRACRPTFRISARRPCCAAGRARARSSSAGCNLRCVFCQNYETSQQGEGAEVGPHGLARMMLELQARGCHNINFVTPEHVVPQILESLPYAIEGGLRLPIVYNTSAYDSLDSLRLMEGVVDVYMPDFKLWTRERAR